MIYLNLAFDHELSLGGVTSSYEQNLLGPTRQILDLASDLSVPVTFFTDVLCGIRFREWDSSGFSESYEAQLQDAAKRGHDVQLHLHPHWIDSTFDGRRFVPADRYALHDFRAEAPPNDIDGIVSRGVEFLNDVIRPVDASYRCHAFRAGGLVIEPSQKEIIAALRRQGIRFDSSIAPGYRFVSDVSGVDFTGAPAAGNWVIGENGLIEVPIATVPRNALNNLPALARRVVRRSLAPDTGGFPLYDTDSGALEKLSRLFPRSAWFLSFDLYWASGKYLMSILRKYLSSRSVGECEDVYVSTLSHPKSMGRGGLKVMAEFVDEAHKEFGSDLEFVTFPEIDRLTVDRPG